MVRPRPVAADQGRVPAHRDRHRPRRLGQLGPGADGGLPLGHLPVRAQPRPRDRVRPAQGRARLAGGARRVPRRPAAAAGRAGRHRARLGGAAALPGRHRAEPVRPAQPVPGQRGGRPPPVGHGVPAARLLRPGRPGGGRAAAAAALRRPGQPAHPGRVQRADHRLAVVLHVHLLHRPGRQVPARHAQGERLRPAVADLRVHAPRGSAPHVRRHHRRAAHRPAHRAAPGRARRGGQPVAARRDPAGGHPEVPELPVRGVARPVRLGDLVQRGRVLHRRAQGPVDGDPAGRRPRAGRARPWRSRTWPTAPSGPGPCPC